MGAAKKDRENTAKAAMDETGTEQQAAGDTLQLLRDNIARLEAENKELYEANEIWERKVIETGEENDSLQTELTNLHYLREMEKAAKGGRIVVVDLDKLKPRQEKQLKALLKIFAKHKSAGAVDLKN